MGLCKQGYRKGDKEYSYLVLRLGTTDPFARQALEEIEANQYSPAEYLRILLRQRFPVKRPITNG